MVDRYLLREFDISDEELELAADISLAEAEHLEEGSLDHLYNRRDEGYDVNAVLEGTVVRVEGEEVLIDIGYKSEGIVPIDEWEVPPVAGDKVSVLLEEIEDEFGLILLSKKKADRIREWEKVISTHKEGDVVEGKVLRKIKGGLLVDIGVNVFLPASQVDIRRPQDIEFYRDKTIECLILKIDESRRNIVVSRRRLIELQREKMKKDLLSDITEGQLRKGTVKNIADFGAFVDLGGIDGLLHITDMSWGRIGHPSEMVKIDQEVEVMILHVDRDKEKIALGLKQKEKSPWDNVEGKYPVGTKIRGEVVNVMSYGAFVKLEDGIEGLVHISEMSWTKRVNHPTELVNPGDEVDVVVLGINKDKQEISLGMKQAQPNPWDEVAAKYPPGASVSGTVRNLTNYGAFIELEEGVDGLLHVSDMSWTRKISHANEMLKKGDPITCQVISVDQERKRIALGKVTKITNFGVFVELEPELEGLLHVSELSDQKVENPETFVKVGQELDVRILRIDSTDRKIGLSRKSNLDLSGANEEAKTGDAAAAPKPKAELKGGMEGSAGPLFTLGSGTEKEKTETEEEAT